MKTIWIIDHYSSEPRFGGISRQYDFALELSKRGYQVVIIASGFSHFTHSYISEEDIFTTEIAETAHYVYLKTKQYESNGGVGRAKNMFSFLRQVTRYQSQIAKKYGAPDVVNGCSVHPLAWVAAYRIARKYKIRFCIEVRDLWPRIWVVGGDKKVYDPMVIFFGMIEKWAYKHADRIIYSMPHGDKYICDELGYPRSKVRLIGQPMACEKFDVNSRKTDQLPEEIRTFMNNGFICSFAGYYMEYEGVYVMLEAAKILRDKGIMIKMIFVGSGEEMAGMKEFREQNHLDNVMIWGRISKETVPALLAHSDVCMVHLEVKGHPEVYQYGVSKNKVNEYLYSGSCTLYGFHDTEDEVVKSGGGIMFEPYHAEDLAEKIEAVYNMSEEQRRRFGINGRKYIRENRSVEVLANRLLEVLFE